MMILRSRCKLPLNHNPQQFLTNDKDNKVSPNVTSGGDFSVAWERSVGDDSTVTTTLKPSESVDVEWNDGALAANINMPLRGTDITGTNVTIKR